MRRKKPFPRQNGQNFSKKRSISPQKPIFFAKRTSLLKLHLERKNGFSVDAALVRVGAWGFTRVNVHRHSDRGFAGIVNLERGHFMLIEEIQTFGVQSEIHITDIAHVTIEINVAIADQPAFFELAVS